MRQQRAWQSGNHPAGPVLTWAENAAERTLVTLAAFA
jgi:hypothetical protein